MMEWSVIIPVLVVMAILFLPIALVVRFAGAIVPGPSQERVKKHPIRHLFWLLAAIGVLFLAFAPSLAERRAVKQSIEDKEKETGSPNINLNRIPKGRERPSGNG